MAGFKIHSVDDGRVPAFEHLPASTIKPEIGMALSVAGGVLVQAVGTAVPTYISMCQKEAACEEGDIIPVIRVQSDIIFSAPYAEGITEDAIGEKFTIGDDAVSVAANAGGAVELVGIDGDEALVRFV